MHAVEEVERLALVAGADTHLIDGRLVSGNGSFEVVDPATGRAFVLCPDASRADLDRAVAAARRAFPAWAALGFEARRALIFALADRITEAADDLAPLLTREHG